MGDTAKCSLRAYPLGRGKIKKAQCGCVSQLAMVWQSFLNSGKLKKYYNMLEHECEVDTMTATRCSLQYHSLVLHI